MIVQITVRDESGKYRVACAGDFAATALRQVIRDYGWKFLRLWLGRVCLQMAETSSEDRSMADLWIARYRDIRGIK